MSPSSRRSWWELSCSRRPASPPPCSSRSPWATCWRRSATPACPAATEPERSRSSAETATERLRSTDQCTDLATAWERRISQPADGKPQQDDAGTVDRVLPEQIPRPVLRRQVEGGPVRLGGHALPAPEGVNEEATVRCDDLGVPFRFRQPRHQDDAAQVALPDRPHPPRPRPQQHAATASTAGRGLASPPPVVRPSPVPAAARATRRGPPPDAVPP